jgi:folate-dependent phosphoribosylglycinamide formyltransferase PurN
MVPLKLAVLVSGRGSNLQSIMDSIKEGRLKAQISVVVSNKADAYALERAHNHGIPARHLNGKDYSQLFFNNNTCLIFQSLMNKYTNGDESCQEKCEHFF